MAAAAHRQEAPVWSMPLTTFALAAGAFLIFMNLFKAGHKPEFDK